MLRVENIPVATGLRRNHVHPLRGQFMQQLKYLLKLLPIPEVVGGSCCCSGHQAQLQSLSPWAAGKLARKSSFSPLPFPYIFLSFFLDGRILAPTSAPDFHRIIKEPWELDLQPPWGPGRPPVERMPNPPVGSRVFSPSFSSPWCDASSLACSRLDTGNLSQWFNRCGCPLSRGTTAVRW